MYSKGLQRVFSSKKIKIGDRIKTGKYEGMLMPRSDIGDPNTLVIKLDSGYNIGIRASKPGSIKRIASKAKWSSKESGFTFDKKNPLVSIISTGGTITSKIDYRTGGVTTLINPKDLLEGMPELAEFSRLKLSSPFNIMSESMVAKHWQILAREVAKELKTSEGVVVTHGTDTLHYTAAALSFMLKNLGKPVILAGSQRSSDRGSSDSAMNLICSARAALSDIAAVGICMHASINDDYCILTRGTKVRKMHTSRRDAFRPINDLPLAKIWPDGKIQKLRHVKPRSGGKVKVDTAFENSIAILKTYPGSNPALLDHLVSKGYRGIVLQLTGIGQAPTYGDSSWLDSIKKATEKGVLICGAADTLYGRLNPNVYTEGRLTKEAGLLHLEDMLAETAYVKLGWVLGHTKSLEKAKEMMLTNYAGELSPRTLPDSYLY